MAEVRHVTLTCACGHALRFDAPCTRCVLDETAHAQLARQLDRLALFSTRQLYLAVFGEALAAAQLRRWLATHGPRAPLFALFDALARHTNGHADSGSSGNAPHALSDSGRRTLQHLAVRLGLLLQGRLLRASDASDASAATPSNSVDLLGISDLVGTTATTTTTEKSDKESREELVQVEGTQWHAPALDAELLMRVVRAEGLAWGAALVRVDVADVLTRDWLTRLFVPLAATLAREEDAIALFCAAPWRACAAAAVATQDEGDTAVHLVAALRTVLDDALARGRLRLARTVLRVLVHTANVVPSARAPALAAVATAPPPTPAALIAAPLLPLIDVASLGPADLAALLAHLIFLRGDARLEEYAAGAPGTKVPVHTAFAARTLACCAQQGRVCPARERIGAGGDSTAARLALFHFRTRGRTTPPRFPALLTLAAIARRAHALSAGATADTAVDELFYAAIVFGRDCGQQQQQGKIAHEYGALVEAYRGEAADALLEVLSAFPTVLARVLALLGTHAAVLAYTPAAAAAATALLDRAAPAARRTPVTRTEVEWLSVLMLGTRPPPQTEALPDIAPTDAAWTAEVAERVGTDCRTRAGGLAAACAEVGMHAFTALAWGKAEPEVRALGTLVLLGARPVLAPARFYAAVTRSPGAGLVRGPVSPHAARALLALAPATHRTPVDLVFVQALLIAAAVAHSLAHPADPVRTDTRWLADSGFFAHLTYLVRCRVTNAALFVVRRFWAVLMLATRPTDDNDEGEVDIVEEQHLEEPVRVCVERLCEVLGEMLDGDDASGTAGRELEGTVAACLADAARRGPHTAQVRAFALWAVVLARVAGAHAGALAPLDALLHAGYLRGWRLPRAFCAHAASLGQTLGPLPCGQRGGAPCLWLALALAQCRTYTEDAGAGAQVLAVAARLDAAGALLAAEQFLRVDAAARRKGVECIAPSARHALHEHWLVLAHSLAREPALASAYKHFAALLEDDSGGDGASQEGEEQVSLTPEARAAIERLCPCALLLIPVESDGDDGDEEQGQQQQQQPLCQEATSEMCAAALLPVQPECPEAEDDDDRACAAALGAGVQESLAALDTLSTQDENSSSGDEEEYIKQMKGDLGVPTLVRVRAALEEARGLLPEVGALDRALLHDVRALWTNAPSEQRVTARCPRPRCGGTLTGVVALTRPAPAHPDARAAVERNRTRCHALYAQLTVAAARLGTEVAALHALVESVLSRRAADAANASAVRALFLRVVALACERIAPPASTVGAAVLGAAVRLGRARAVQEDARCQRRLLRLLCGAAPRDAWTAPVVAAPVPLDARPLDRNERDEARTTTVGTALASLASLADLFVPVALLQQGDVPARFGALCAEVLGDSESSTPPVTVRKALLARLCAPATVAFVLAPGNHAPSTVCTSLQDVAAHPAAAALLAAYLPRVAVADGGAAASDALRLALVHDVAAAAAGGDADTRVAPAVLAALAETPGVGRDRTVLFSLADTALDATRRTRSPAAVAALAAVLETPGLVALVCAGDAGVRTTVLAAAEAVLAAQGADSGCATLFHVLMTFVRADADAQSSNSKEKEEEEEDCGSAGWVLPPATATVWAVLEAHVLGKGTNTALAQASRLVQEMRGVRGVWHAFTARSCALLRATLTQGAGGTALVAVLLARVDWGAFAHRLHDAASSDTPGAAEARTWLAELIALHAAALIACPAHAPTALAAAPAALWAPAGPAALAAVVDGTLCARVLRALLRVSVSDAVVDALCWLTTVAIAATKATAAAAPAAAEQEEEEGEEDAKQGREVWEAAVNAAQEAVAAARLVVVLDEKVLEDGGHGKRGVRRTAWRLSACAVARLARDVVLEVVCCLYSAAGSAPALEDARQAAVSQLIALAYPPAFDVVHRDTSSASSSSSSTVAAENEAVGEKYARARRKRVGGLVAQFCTAAPAAMAAEVMNQALRRCTGNSESGEEEEDKEGPLALAEACARALFGRFGDDDACVARALAPLPALPRTPTPRDVAACCAPGTAHFGALTARLAAATRAPRAAPPVAAALCARAHAPFVFYLQVARCSLGRQEGQQEEGDEDELGTWLEYVPQFRAEGVRWADVVAAWLALPRTVADEHWRPTRRGCAPVLRALAALWDVARAPPAAARSALLAAGQDAAQLAQLPPRAVERLQLAAAGVVLATQRHLRASLAARRARSRHPDVTSPAEDALPRDIAATGALLAQRAAALRAAQGTADRDLDAFCAVAPALVADEVPPAAVEYLTVKLLFSMVPYLQAL